MAALSEAAYSAPSMDQATARDLVHKGAILLLLDVPPRTAVGIDHQASSPSLVKDQSFDSHVLQ